MNVGWRERNQQHATNPVFVTKLLSQHVSGIIMPIFRGTRLWITAYGVLHWLCWLWLCGVGLLAVCTEHTASSLTPQNHSQHNQCRTPHAVIHNLVPLKMGIMMHCAHSTQPNSTQPQTAQPVQNTICSYKQSFSPEDGHNDARNMLRYKFGNKHQISCILLVSFSSP